MTELQRADGKRVSGRANFVRDPDQAGRSFPEPGRRSNRVTAARIARAGRGVAARRAGWQFFRDGRSLDRAIGAAVVDHPELRPAVQDATYTAVRHLAAGKRIVERLAARQPGPDVAALLAVSLGQLLTGSDTPHTVIVDQAVRAAQRLRKRVRLPDSSTPLLRNFLRQREALLAELQPRCQRAIQPSCVVDRPFAQRVSGRVGVDRRVTATPASAGAARQCKASLSADDYLARLRSTDIEATRVGAHAVWLHQPRPVTGHSGLSRGRRVGPGCRRSARRGMARRQAGHARARRVCCAWRQDGASGRTRRDRLDRVEVDAARAERIDDNLRRGRLERARGHR